jgi:hypothetical protein
LEHVVTSHSRWPESTVLHSLNINNREERSKAFTPLIPGMHAVDVDVEGLDTVVDAEVVEAVEAAEEGELTTIPIS